MKLNSFHNRCARFITGRHITKIDDQWHYPETKQTLELAHVLPVEDYIIKRKNTILDFAYNTNVYKTCQKATRIIIADNSLEWWSQNNKVCIPTNIGCSQNSSIESE